MKNPAAYILTEEELNEIEQEVGLNSYADSQLAMASEILAILGTREEAAKRNYMALRGDIKSTRECVELLVKIYNLCE